VNKQGNCWSELKKRFREIKVFVLMKNGDLIKRVKAMDWEDK